MEALHVLLLLLFGLLLALGTGRIFSHAFDLYHRKGNTTRVAKVRNSDDIFMIITWAIAVCICTFIFYILMVS